MRAMGAGSRAEALATSLSHASRILPIVTTAHLPSAACDAYWPEVYWNQPIVDEPRPNPYGDTPSPKTFTHVSPLDPQLFSTMHEHAEELLLSQERSGQYSPLEVATWLEDLASAVSQQHSIAGPPLAPADRRVIVDTRIQAGLGRFFAAKFRAGVLYAIHEKTSDRGALEAAIAHYRRARQAWAELVEDARVYAADLSASDRISERGQWSDRLAAIDDDIAVMTQRVGTARSDTSDPRVRAAVTAGQARHGDRPSLPITHVPPTGFTPGAALSVELMIPDRASTRSVRCFYRHVNQAERFQSVVMARDGERFRASVPGWYTDSPYPLQYYFAVIDAATLYPGLGSTRMALPYFVVHRLANG